ncbi:rodlin [Streptomyces sp. NPDC005506]|uniref:rodlin n=1 Tax=unclassified Streptomyces TaxID=2593676 RepID=UPI0036BE4D67
MRGDGNSPVSRPCIRQHPDVSDIVRVKRHIRTRRGELIKALRVAARDVDILSSPQNQQCTENSTQAKGDEALSHILDDIPVLSGNGTGNS